MEFLYPKSRQFPFDEVCEQIVRALEERNWQVPGIEVEFDEYGTGDSKFRLLRNLRGENFKLHFGRVQGRAGNDSRHTWNDTAAVTDIVIPKKEIHVYDDESGPTFYLYVGKHWKRDRDQFIDGSKVNSKLNGKPKMYLQYTGGCNCQQTRGASFPAVRLLETILTRDAKALAQMHHTHSRWRPPVLVHTNDLGREYDPEGKEPSVFQTTKVMEEFRQYLENVVLAMVISQPVSSTKVDAFAQPEPIPFPDSISHLFTFGEWRDEERIRTGKEDPSKLEPSNRYGMLGSGYRLVPYDLPKIGDVPKIAYDGFLWCGTGEIDKDTPIDSLEVPGHHRSSDRERYVLRVTPNRANGIYIADHAVYEKRRIEIGELLSNEKPQRTRFTDAELADFTCARGRTIIPISEYTGNFEQPVVLINRELSFDEVEVVSGPHKTEHELKRSPK